MIEPNELNDSDDDEEQDIDEAEEMVERQQSANGDCLYGKDGTKWKKDEPAAGRMRQHYQHNILHFRAGPKQQNSVSIEVFKRFFTPNISFIIITETNRYAKNTIQKSNVENPDSGQRVWIDLTSTELEAFIGILLTAGVSHNNMEDAEVLWRTDSLPIFRAAMSYRRFLALSRYIRFDDGRTREFRQRTDKAA